MATSPTGQVDLHDWRRLLELFVQATITFVITWSLTIVPTLSVTGKYGAVWVTIQPIIILLLTELGKRYLQSSTPPVIPMPPPSTNPAA